MNELVEHLIVLQSTLDGSGTILGLAIVDPCEGDRLPDYSRGLGSNPSIRTSSCWSGLAGFLRRQIEVVFLQGCFDSCVFPSTTEQLVMLLYEDEYPSLQEHAATALAELAAERENWLEITDSKMGLPGLARLLAKVNYPSMQMRAALALGNLAAQEGSAQSINKCDCVLTGLVTLLYDHRNLPAQKEAAIALANLGFWPEGRKMIMKTAAQSVAGLLEIMVSMHGNVRLYEEATRALRNLAVSREYTEKILKVPKTLAALVGLLFTADGSRVVQENASRVLAFLSYTIDNARRIVESQEFPLVLEVLVKLLHRDDGDNLKIKEMAAMTMTNLLITEEIQLKVAKSPNALEGLVKALIEDGNPSLQQNAAMALGNLALAKHNRRKIVHFDYAVPYLARMLFHGQNPGGQEHAAWALANLSHSGDGNRKIIGRFPDALGGLLGLLSDQVSCRVKEQAVRALGNLTYVHVNQMRIARFPNAMTVLVALMSEDDKPVIQEHVARTFANLTCAEENWKFSEYFFADAVIDSLASLLSTKKHVQIQEYGAISLGNLALCPGNQRKIVRSHDALAGLVDMMFNFENKTAAQESSAWAVANLAYFGDHYCKVEIARFPRALAALVGLLRKHKSPHVQEQALRAMAGLAEVHRHQVIIKENPRVLTGLLELLSKFYVPAVDQHADTKNRKDVPDVSTSFASSVIKEDRSLEEQERLEMVSNNIFVAHQEGSRKIEPGSAVFPNTLEVVMSLLSKHEQGSTSCAMVPLVGEYEDLQVEIAETPGAIGGLVELLLNDDNPRMQEQAVTALVTLACVQKITKKIAGLPGAIECIARILGRQSWRPNL